MKRDCFYRKIKRELSVKNNVKLIYINYTDPITEEFILQKVNEAKKHG